MSDNGKTIPARVQDASMSIASNEHATSMSVQDVIEAALKEASEAITVKNVNGQTVVSPSHSDLRKTVERLARIVGVQDAALKEISNYEQDTPVGDPTPEAQLAKEARAEVRKLVDFGGDNK